jgi:hypothetical protein
MAVYLILHNGSHDPFAGLETRNAVADSGHLVRVVGVGNCRVEDSARSWIA